MGRRFVNAREPELIHIKEVHVSTNGHSDCIVQDKRVPDRDKVETRSIVGRLIN